MAMLLALRLALGYVTNIQLTESIKIGFTIFPTTIACMMFGPVPGLVMGGAADLIGFFLKPTGPFFPGYTEATFIRCRKALAPTAPSLKNVRGLLLFFNVGIFCCFL